MMIVGISIGREQMRTNLELDFYDESTVSLHDDIHLFIKEDCMILYFKYGMYSSKRKKNIGVTANNPSYLLRSAENRMRHPWSIAVHFHTNDINYVALQSILE
jgi:hypothetical protein